MAVTYGRGCCKWAVWWAVSVASLLALVQGQPQNCTVEYRQHFLCNITRGEMCPLVERVSESWPPPPSKFSVGSFMDEFVQKNTTFLVPGLKFTWKPPPNSGYKSVTGFEMNLIIASGKHTNKQECFTFRLSDEIPDLETTFEYSIFPVKYTTRYVVQLYSLPKPDPNYSADNFVMESILTPRFIQKDHPVPSTWKFGMNKGVDVCKAEIYCSFTIPPKSLNITAVDVGLLKKGQANYFEIKLVVFANNHHTAVFEDVPPAEYQIQLTVVDDYHHDPQRCVCRNHKGQCDTCVVTVSEYFNMSSNRSGCPTTSAPATSAPTTLESTTFNSSTSSVASPSVGQSTTTDTEDQTVKYVGVALGLVIAVLLIVLLIFILRRKGVMCCGNKDDYFSGDNKPPIPPTTTANIINNNNNNKAPEALKPFLRERVIYLVYSDDNAYHQKVVKAFARYLSAQCKCVVRYPRWCLPEIRSQGTINWVLQSIQEADFVLIVNSEGAFRLNEARKEGTTPCQFDNSSIGDIFTPAIQNVIGNFYKRQAYDKYIMMQFSYSDDKFQIGEISPGYKYTLIKHFRELLCHIHNINTEKPGAVSQSLPLHPDDHERTVEGRELLQAVREATAFTKSYPDWYSAMYSPDDDCYDSGLGSVPVDSFPDFMQEEIHQSCAENQQRMEAIHRKNLLNGDVGHSFVPTQRNDDLLSVTQSQVTMAPPMDLYSLFTDLGQDGREAGICETGGYMGGPVDHTCLMSQTSCGHTDSGHGSQRSNASQQSHPGIFNMQAMMQCPDNFIPPADMDSVSWGSQYEAMHNAMMDQGFPADHQGPMVDASVFDNISVDAMSV